MQTVTNPDPPTQHFEYHPLSFLFPLLDEQSDEFVGMVADIRLHGLREPIILFDGKVLDGRNRLRACHAAACEPRFERFKSDSEDDARAYVISRNLHRRHLTKEQRDERIRTLRAQGMTMDAIAQTTNVGRGTVERAIKADQVISHTGKSDEQGDGQRASIVNARGQERPATYAARTPREADASPEFKSSLTESSPSPKLSLSERQSAARQTARRLHNAVQDIIRLTGQAPEGLLAVVMQGDLQAQFRTDLDDCITALTRLRTDFGYPRAKPKRDRDAVVRAARAGIHPLARTDETNETGEA